MLSGNSYLSIDMERTGRRLENLMNRNGYSVKDIQSILHLSCPQPIYRWMRGQILPSVNHLYVLANVLKVHMDELLVPISERTGEIVYFVEWKIQSGGFNCNIDNNARKNSRLYNVTAS